MRLRSFFDYVGITEDRTKAPKAWSRAWWLRILGIVIFMLLVLVVVEAFT